MPLLWFLGDRGYRIMEFASHRQPPKEWIEIVDRWVSDLRIHGDTEKTVEHWWYVVTQFARDVKKSPEDISDIDIVDWLNRGVGSETLRSSVNALNTFFNWAERTKRLSHNPMTGIPPVKRRRKKQQPAPPEAVQKGKNSTDQRVRLLVRLFADAGLRRNEAVIAHTTDLIDDLAGKSLIIHGKGEKDRIVPLDPVLSSEIQSLPPGWVFPGEKGHICADTAYRIVKDATGWSPHAFRRRFATDVWRATGDVLKVQSLLGHESLATTQTYIYDTADDMRDAVKSLQSYRSHYGIKLLHPDRILAAYGLPDELITQILDTASKQESYTQQALFS